VTTLLSFLLMLIIVGGMAVGVVFGRKPIAGSCGGLKALGMNVQCEICGGDPDACETAKGSRADPEGLAAPAVRGKRTL
jgi:hypothetical protein